MPAYRCKKCGYINNGLQYTYFYKNKLVLPIIISILVLLPIIIISAIYVVDEGGIYFLLLFLDIALAYGLWVFMAKYKVKMFRKKSGISKILPNNGIILNESYEFRIGDTNMPLKIIPTDVD